jgi:FkbM family methyltransferase
MRVSPRYRDAARRVSRRLGVDDAARRVWEIMEPAARRDRLDNEHLRLLMAFALREDSNCIDIGAHAGVLLREMVRCSPKGRHIAYEPLPELADRLRRDFPMVDVRNAAVSNASGEAAFHRVRRDPMASALKLRRDVELGPTETITVKLEKLDDALPSGYVPSLIKIDVEGGEREVLEGAIQTISDHSPIVCFEHGPGAEGEYGTSPEQVYEILVRQVGMQIFDIDGNGPYSESQFVNQYRQPIWNFVAHR